MNLVFMYGLFRKGERRNSVLGNSRFLTEDETSPIFTMRLMKPSEMPIVITKGNTSIKGEIYAVDSSIYKTLFQAENVPFFCVPKKIRTNKHFICTIFVASPNLLIHSKSYIDRYPIIQTGDWFSYAKKSDSISLPPVQCKC